MASILPAIFVCWCLCGLVVAYAYPGYGLLIWIMARLFGDDARPSKSGDGELPNVSLLIAAFNEESVIESRLVNALASDYPRDKLQIVVGSDGSDDKTNAIVGSFADRGVELIDYPLRRGKATVLNESIPSLTGQIVVLSDANTFMDASALRKLARWFADPQVLCVCGRLLLGSADGSIGADGMYWRYETFLKMCESRLGALLGSNGAIYAIRREYFVPVRPDTLVDDFVIPLLARLRHGGRIVYDAQAVAREETAPDIAGEFKRRSRIGAGGFQSIGMLWPLLNPLRGWISLAFVSHKILRWLCPFAMIGFFVLNLLILNWWWARYTLILQSTFYACCLVGAYVPTHVTIAKPLRLGAMFVSMNAALAVGFVRWMRGPQSGTWARTARSTEMGRV